MNVHLRIKWLWVRVPLQSHNNSISFKFKEKIKGETTSNGTKDVSIMVPLKNLSNFWRTLEMSLINCEIILILTWSVNCFSFASTESNEVAAFPMTDTKLYVPVVILSIQDNEKPLQQLKTGFNRTIT